MRSKRVRAIVALTIAGGLFVGVIVANAGALSSVDGAYKVRRDLREQIERIHERRQEQRVAIHQQLRHVFKHLRDRVGPTQAGRDRNGMYRRYRHQQLKQIRTLRRQERAVVKAARVKVAALRARRTNLLDWIDTYGIFRYCPVDGPVSVADNFGVMVNLPGVPPHVHQGNDMTAATGTPIVAPFDGTAVAGSSDLGGMSVDVYGDLGHVYNAHLSAYGTLGEVSAGTIIGYVGSTGDATGPHDHFEWHPGDGPAVDPNPFLSVVC